MDARAVAVKVAPRVARVVAGAAAAVVARLPQRRRRETQKAA